MKKIALKLIPNKQTKGKKVGLVEKRAIKEFQETIYSNIHERIIEAAKFEVEVEIKWDSLQVDNQAHNYNEAFPQLYFVPLIESLKSITADELGAEALKNVLKKIVIRNEDGRSDGLWAEFNDGILDLNKDLSNAEQVQRRTQAVIEVLEQAL